MLKQVRKMWRGDDHDSPGGFRFERPLLVLQSDDWGRVGVRDREGYDELRAAGITLGQHPYDFYTLETAEDVSAVSSMLKQHHDSTGRSPCLVMNFVMANLDFRKIADGGFREISLRTLSSGLPGNWKRPGLFEAYRQGIADGVFYPALHGLTHFCQLPVTHALTGSGERTELLRTLWKAQTPYIYWRMPWVGYEYCNPEKPDAGFLSTETQQDLIRLAAEGFAKFFKLFPKSACAPGYRANSDTHAAWAKWGVRVAQNGTGAPLPPQMDEYEILQLHRTVDIEPAQRDLPVEKYVQLAADCFHRGVPAVVSVHAVNFHSSLKDFRGPTLQALDQFLSALEQKYPDLLYVHDEDLYQIVTRGNFESKSKKIPVTVKQAGNAKARSVSWGSQ